MTKATIKGFKCAGLHSGIKRSGAFDLGLIVAERPVPCAGVFTTNQVVAAPVTQSRARLTECGLAQAIVVNSGNANACTGADGARDARQMAELVADVCGCDVQHVQVCSTGVIGAPLPMAKMKSGIKSAALNLDVGHFEDFADAILTTDTRRKVEGGAVNIGGREIHILGASKGAGMIHPNMATMLGFILTDAPIEKTDLDTLWRRVCAQTFNAITVDGDTSTNDTALIMASGAAGGPPLDGEDLATFEHALRKTAEALARAIVRDAEGANKLVDITVEGARSMDEAVLASNAIALSPLVKTAIHGEDPNWGRIIAAAGRSGARLNPHVLTLTIGDVLIYGEGSWMGRNAEAKAHKVMKGPQYTLTINLGVGQASRTVTTCDLSADYVSINADYRS